jgi:hypothetical protein
MAGTKQIRLGKVIRFKESLEQRLQILKELNEQELTKDIHLSRITELELIIEKLEQEFQL